jgi:hypothetical protein
LERLQGFFELRQGLELQAPPGLARARPRPKKAAERSSMPV